MGAEYNLSAREFTGDGWGLEGILQLGPVVFVTSSHGWAVFYTPKISAGASGLIGNSRFVSVTPVLQ
jgi:hypothetical protein